MGLTLTVLGSSGSYPIPERACSGYLVRSEATTVWIDAGTGSLANLQRHVDLLDVDAIVLSHDHPDHWTDLTGYVVACRYYRHRDVVPVYAPESVRARALYKDPPIEWHIVTDASRASIGDLVLTFSKTDHGPETLAVRVDGGGRSLGYSADSGPAWRLSSLGSGLDLVLCEATYLQDEEGGEVRHMSAREAGANAREAGAARLLLTHLKPGLDRAAAMAEGAAAFGRAVELAEDNEVYEV